MENPVRSTTKEVVEQAEFVKIDRSRIKELAKEWVSDGESIEAWDLEHHLNSQDEEQLLTYYIVLDTLQSCFWNTEKERWHITYNDKKESGYFALSLSLKKFFEESPEKAAFQYLEHIADEEFKEILQGGENLYFLEERAKNLRAVSRVINKKYEGDSRRFVGTAEKSAEKLTQRIVGELPSFNDEAAYDGERVFLWKRAQILVGDIWGALGGKGYGEFHDIGWLTAFADYKIPQILRYWEVFEYKKELEESINNKKLIESGSKEEVEIRSAAIWAVEYIKEELEKGGVKKNALEIDWLLWNKSKEIDLPNPYHLTKTIFY